MQWISISLLLCCLAQYCVSSGFVHANTDGSVFLERGQRGVVPCPLVKSRQIPPGDVDAMYWYYGSTSDTSLLISYFFGRVAPQNGIPEGVYDIDDEFNLIIENVTASNEGTYYFQVKPRLKMIEEGQVEVREFVLADTDDPIFLDRGHRGIVPCPLVKSRQILPVDVDAINWHYGTISDTSLLISNFMGRVHPPPNGIPEGVYDIDNEFSLIIENVTASNEGTYYFRVKLHLMVKEGHVEVCDMVSPSRPYPTVIGCNQDHDADTCEAKVRHDSTVHNLTCVMEQVKPAVQLRWIRLFWGGQTELNAYITVRPVVLPAYTSSSLRNNTYSTTASIEVPSVGDCAEYVCEAVGVAVGKSTRTKVFITGSFGQANTNGTVFLERGQRGIVPCPLVKSRQIPSDDVDAIYWYYGSISRTSLLISYFSGRVAPQNGIPEGVYDIDNEFNLIIENVNASNEGSYYFHVKPRLKMIQEGHVEVCDKVSPNRPYPTVIGCDQVIHDAHMCEVRVRHDSTVHDLTCVMDQVKPAVQLRWLRVFWGGWRDLTAYTTMESSLRKTTYSTSASVEVTAVEDEEVYLCVASGVAVGNGAYMIVRFTKSQLTTATYEEIQSSINPGIQSSINPGTTLVLKEEPASTSVAAVIILSILLVMASIIIVVMFLGNRRLKMILSCYEPVETDPPETEPKEW